MNPDRLPLTTSASYRGLLYIDVLYCGVYCVVLCCMCCVLWRDGAWDGVVVLASFLFHQQLMRGGGEKIMVREAASSGFGLYKSVEKTST